ncbi:hypothetical protein Syun_021100 [Stephania yunnanensis]|uniref:Uncharacterized protein n=1 Tax=Stephania yunnanensis TaxID=152371 RepID=A0AAP0IFZ0_9MAGN
MGTEAALALASSPPQFPRSIYSGVVVLGYKGKYHHAVMGGSKSHISVKNEMKPSTFSARIATDIPLNESLEVSFDQYLTHRSRVFKAIFPDKRRSKRLNEEEWRIHMLPIKFLFLTVWPVVDMRLKYKTQGKDYPAGVPLDTTMVLELNVTRWELQGLDNNFQPSHFTLVVQGILYPDRSRVRSRLKGDLEMKMSCVLPPVLSLVPQDALQGVAELVLKRLVENMKHKVNGSLLNDFAEFKRESRRRHTPSTQ